MELAIVYASDYFPYGKVLREFVDGDGGDRYLTTMHERDKETGLDYRGARYYDSDVARFLSLDPMAIKFPNMSPYNYVMGNPIVLIDASGMYPEPPPHYGFLIGVGTIIFYSAIENGASIQGALLVLAQASLETGWGGTSSVDYNLFGMMAGKGEPSTRSTSHGALKDYSELGGYEGSIDDYYSRLKDKWPEMIELLKENSFTSDDIDKAFNTGKYYPTTEERRAGNYAYCGKDANGNSDYGTKLYAQIQTVIKYLNNAVDHHITIQNELINDLNMKINDKSLSLEERVQYRIQIHQARNEKQNYEQFKELIPQ